MPDISRSVEGIPTIESLQHVLSLTKYEAQIYLTLLTFDSLTPQQISERSEVPRSRCYDTLRRLESKGMVVQIMSRPTRYQALSPSLAFENRFKILKDDLKSRQNEALGLQDRLSKVLQRRREVEELHTVLRIGNIQHLTHLISEDVLNAERQICISMTPHPNFKSWKKIFEAYQTKNSTQILIKHLIPDANSYLQKLEPLRTEVQMQIADGNIQLRTYNGLQQPFAVIDQEISYLFFTNPTSGQIEFALRIKSAPFSRQLDQMFELLWNEAESLKRADNF